MGVTRSKQQYLNYTVIGLDSAENLTLTESHEQLTLTHSQDIGYNLIHAQTLYNMQPEYLGADKRIFLRGSSSGT